MALKRVRATRRRRPQSKEQRKAVTERKQKRPPGGGNNGSETKKIDKMQLSREEIEGIKKAVGTDQRIMPHGRTLAAQATVAEGASTNILRWHDPCGYYSALSLGGNTNSARLQVTGQVTADNVAKEVQSYALLVQAFNYDSNKPSQMNQNIRIWNPTFDGTEGGDVSIDAGKQRRNTQNIEGLQTLRKDGFLITNTTVLGIPVDAPAAGEGELSVTLKMFDIIPVPYSVLLATLYQKEGIDLAKLGK